MPRSKRDKKISLTKTGKHGKEWKKEIYEKVREAGEKYSSIYVIRVDGMRIGGINEVRKHFRGSAIFLGKNKVMALALGKDEASEVNVNTHKIAERLVGQCGLLFTDLEESEVTSYFETFVETDYARSGTKAKSTVILQEGPLKQFAHSIEPHLRSLGMPTQLKKGVVTLVQEFTVCKKGQPLNPNQANILKLLELPTAEFRIKIDSKWTKPDDFKVLLTETEDDEEQEEEEEEEVDDVEMGDEVDDVEDDEEVEEEEDE